MKDQSRKGLLENLDVIIGKERLTFLLDKMEIVGNVGLNRATLQRIFPPLVHFVGPDDLIRRLKSPKVLDKVLTIEGLLYTSSRTIFLIGMEVDEDEEADDPVARLDEKDAAPEVDEGGSRRNQLESLYEDA